MAGRDKHKVNNRKAAMYRRVRHNRPAIFAISIIVGLLLVVISVDSKSLMEKEKTLSQKQEELTAQLEYEENRTEELEEFEKYTKTKKYAEEMAKKKLGLVHDNEIIFKSGNGK